MSNNPNNNWTETEEGWVKKDQRTTRGTSPFEKPMPPVRDGNGSPLIRGGNGKIDWDLLAKERAAKKGQS